MLKEPSTTKMKRLLMQLIECDPKNVKQIREMQEDSRKVLGFPEAVKKKKRCRYQKRGRHGDLRRG